MSILPRGASPQAPIRFQIEATNGSLQSRFAESEHVQFIDISQRFLAADRSSPAELIPDQVHPSEAGYRLWADALIAAGVKQ